MRNEDGKSCELRLTPYRTADNRIAGVVLTVLGVDDFESAPRARSGGDGAGRKGAKAKAATRNAPKKGKGKK